MEGIMINNIEEIPGNKERAWIVSGVAVGIVSIVDILDV